MSKLNARTREIRERDEHERLAPVATKADQSKGRERDEPEDAYRTCFERDRDRILHSNAFRRLKHKTQVFLNPEGDHFVTRITHTQQVAQVGRSIAIALGLNEALAEAVCLGHDIGHSPFGHTGEVALSPYMPDEHWQHAIQGVRIARKLEPMNLTWEVLDGIRASSWKNDPRPATAEGMVCRFADRIAYLSHDALDALRAGVLERDQIPGDIVKAFGEPGSPWIDAMVRAVIDASAEAGEVTMEPSALETMHRLREFMFDTVYLRHDAQVQSRKAVRVIRALVDWFSEHPEEIPAGYALPDSGPVQQAVDYVSGMTDRFAIACYDRLFRPEGLF